MVEMLSRRKYWIDLVIKVIMIVMLLLLIMQVKAQQVNTNALFFLYTKNTITAYELNFDNQEKLNKVNPLKVKMEKLVAKPLKQAVKSKYIGRDTFELRLAAYQKMSFYLLKSTPDQTYKLYIKDGSERLLLKRISIKINQGSFKQPRYQYIDLVTFPL